MAVKPLTKEQATILTVMTGVLIMDPLEFRKELTKKLGREVGPAEFANPDFIEELQGLYGEEFSDLCELVEDSGLLLPH